MPQYTEDDIAQAIKDVANGAALKSAAKEWGVPPNTLRDRIKGSEGHSIAAESQQRLSRVQEDHLANWILAQEALGVPLTHAQIKEFAQRLLVLKGDPRLLGKRWMQAFLRRNPILKTKRFRNIDSQRVNSATTPIIKAWFQLLLLPQIQAIKPEHRYNMDESGIMEGFGANGLVVGSAGKRSI
jgi:4-hydroxybenzoate polyprenyltransferase